MTTLVAPPPALAPGPAVGGLTLEQRLEEAWRELQDYAAACPVCGGRMAPAGHAGRCDGCGSELR